MSKKALDEQLAALQALRAASTAMETNPDEDALASRLRPFLLQHNNLVIARAADLARDLQLSPLLDDLAAVFRRLVEAPAKKDPQCWAKNSVSKALHQLGCEDSALFITGMRVHQFEPVWGSQSDVAGTLRSNCAHALVDCRELSHHVLLLHLLELVNDHDKSVRSEAIRAIAAAGGDGAILLLRLRALTAASESPEDRPEVMSHCYAGLLSLEGIAAVPFIAQFLKAQDDCSAEAALALGAMRTPEALDALLSCLRSPEVRRAPRTAQTQTHLEPAFAAALLTGIALTRHPRAIDTLIELVSTESALAESALEALATADFGSNVQERLVTIVQALDNPRIARFHQKYFLP